MSWFSRAVTREGRSRRSRQRDVLFCSLERSDEPLEFVSSRGPLCSRTHDALPEALELFECGALVEWRRSAPLLVHASS